MKFFGWKSAGREPSRPVLSRGYSPFSSFGTGGSSQGEWPRGYEAQVRDGFVANPVAQRAVRLVSEGVGSAPVTASDPAALALIAAKSGGQSLIETMAMQLLLHGNAFVQVLADEAGFPRELFALRPERVTIEADARGWPAAFLYKAGTAVTRLAAEDARGAAAVIHVKTVHPLDDHYGLGCLGAAAGATAIHNAATRWNKALLDNAARPSGALVYEPGEPGAVLAAEQFARLRAELDASFAGAGNAGRPMLLEGGLKWQSLSLSPADMDFVGLKAAAAREIALAFGVPPMLLGLPGDATYANYREANKALWRLAVLPLAGLILDGLAQGLRPHFAGLTLAVDPDRVTALSEDRERLWAQVEAASFLTLNEKRAALGFGPVEVPEPAGSVEPTSERTTATEEAAPVEVKFNPWHDPDDGKFTFSEQGVHYGAGESGSAGGSNRPKSPVARKPRAAGEPTRRRKTAEYFSLTVEPTVENALVQIRVSKFGKTKAGRYVIDKIERLHKAGKIRIADLGPLKRGQRTKDGIVVSASLATDVNKLASELVHEATHDLLSDEYRRTNRHPNASSIEQELLTNGYQLQLYREQRKYAPPDEELERRLTASNAGKLRQNIRFRYPKLPMRQP